MARATGTVHEVKMLNKHPEENERFVFSPNIVEAKLRGNEKKRWSDIFARADEIAGGSA